ncbi:MAG: glycosyltransferase family 4 protein [Acidimicrobiia bacterium]
MTPLRVLSLTSYPSLAAATRYRVQQFQPALREHGVELTLSSFLDDDAFGRLYEAIPLSRKAADVAAATMRRIRQLPSMRRYDVLFIQREAMLVGPPLIEWFAHRSGLPIVLDLDDPTYLKYRSPNVRPLVARLKCHHKGDTLIGLASHVIAGSTAVAEYVLAHDRPATLLPTIVDLEQFRPMTADRAVPVLGWVGTPSTFPFLEAIFPTLQRLAETQRFTLRVVGSGKDRIVLPGVDVEAVPWSLHRELDDFRSIDVGLYPLPTSGALREWTLGKSGLKAIQYLACGVPFVMTPVGAGAEIGEPGHTHFAATTDSSWHHALELLLKDPALRSNMGERGRGWATQHLSLSAQAATLAGVLRSVAAAQPRTERNLERTA